MFILELVDKKINCSKRLIRNIQKSEIGFGLLGEKTILNFKKVLTYRVRRIIIFRCNKYCTVLKAKIKQTIKTCVVKENDFTTCTHGRYSSFNEIGRKYISVKI